MSAIEVEIAGVGIHPFGRFEDRSVTDMGVTAVRAALAEAGVGRGDFQAAFCGTAYAGVAAGHKVLGALALTGIPIVDIEAGCASGGAALQLAAGAIRAGQYDCVLVFGMEKMPKGIIRSCFFEPWREEAGLAATPAYFALRAQRLMRESGLTKDDLARVVVKNRRNGVHNPNAMFRKEVTAEEVLGSRLVCDPLHLFMLCSPNEGAAAVVLRKASGAGAGPGDARRRRCCGRTSRAACSARRPRSSGIDDTDDHAADARSRRRTRTTRPGIGPDDVDVVECQDTDAARELLAWEELGLCAPRRAARRSSTPATPTLGGRRPVNPSRRAALEGRAARRVGARSGGRARATSCAARPAPRQVDGARVGLAHTVGRGANASVTILTRLTHPRSCRFPS